MGLVHMRKALIEEEPTNSFVLGWGTYARIV